MKKIYCNKCEEDVELVDGKCPNCKTNWEKEIEELQETIKNDKSDIEEEINNEEVDVIEEDDEMTDKDYEDDSFVFISEKNINRNINFFLKWAKFGKVVFWILAVILGFVALIGAEETDGMSLFLLIGSCMFIFFAYIFENNLKWKAYMLYTNKNSK